eukprot:gene8974-9149_t
MLHTSSFSGPSGSAARPAPAGLSAALLTPQSSVQQQQLSRAASASTAVAGGSPHAAGARQASARSGHFTGGLPAADLDGDISDSSSSNDDDYDFGEMRAGDDRAPVSDQQGGVTNSELQAEFQGLSLFEEDDDEEGVGEEQKLPWHRRPLVLLHIIAFSLSVILFLIGICSQYVPAMQVVTGRSGVELFRWMYFFCAWPVLWAAVNYANNKLFAFIEWLFYREALYYLDSVRRSARGLAFMCLVLPWFVICFWTAWCDGDNDCRMQGPYKTATDVVYKLMVCLTLFSLANFLKALITKLLSSHFYKTAHFKKVKDAIEKEYFLLMLSQPRPTPPAPKPATEPPFFHVRAKSVGDAADFVKASRSQRPLAAKSLGLVHLYGHHDHEGGNCKGLTAADVIHEMPAAQVPGGSGSSSLMQSKQHQAPQLNDSSTRAQACLTDSSTGAAAGQSDLHSGLVSNQPVDSTPLGATAVAGAAAPQFLPQSEVVMAKGVTWGVYSAAAAVREQPAVSTARSHLSPAQLVSPQTQEGWQQSCSSKDVEVELQHDSESLR